MSATTSSLSVVAERRMLKPQTAYWLAAAIIALALLASGTPSPLYGTYSHLWGFSTVVLTLVYATYAFGVLTTLLLAGRLSDDVGRRPVLLSALAALILASVVFMLAQSVVWLFVARAIQGLATGALLSAASAAMLDLHPQRDAGRVGLANGVASTLGMGTGILISSALVQLAPAPRVLPYVTLFALIAVVLVGVFFMPEPVRSRSGLRLRFERPSVPSAIRRPFLLAALAVIASWSIAGLFLSLGPELSATLFKSTSDLLAGLPIFVLCASAAVGQLLFARKPAWLSAVVGSLNLALGMLVIVLADATKSSALLMVGSVIGGFGFGLAFMGGLRALSVVIPHEHRASTMSAFYVVAYLAISVPAVLAGIVVTPLGLRPTFELFGAIVAVVALLVAIEAWRTRPRAAVVAAVSPSVATVNQ